MYLWPGESETKCSRHTTSLSKKRRTRSRAPANLLIRPRWIHSAAIANLDPGHGVHRYQPVGFISATQSCQLRPYLTPVTVQGACIPLDTRRSTKKRKTCSIRCACSSKYGPGMGWDARAKNGFWTSLFRACKHPSFGRQMENPQARERAWAGVVSTFHAPRGRL